MISCFLHKPALQKYVDEGQALSAKAKAHLEKCEGCREMVAAHLAIARQLKAGRGPEVETPAFLHARVMRGLEGETAPRGGLKLGWIGAVAAVVVIGLSISQLDRRRSGNIEVSWPELQTQLAFKAELPANPLEAEIANLRDDTVNAARALAASFLPTSDVK